MTANNALGWALTLPLCACTGFFTGTGMQASNTFAHNGDKRIYVTGDAITLTLGYESPVTVEGQPSVELKIGTQWRSAVYQSGSSTTQLTFSYTIQTGDTDLDGVEVGESLSTALGSVLNVEGAPIVGELPPVMGIDFSEVEIFAPVLLVEPTFSAAPNWNDYINVDTQLACTNPSTQTCVHGGELRKASIVELDSCSDLAAVDSQGVFKWGCEQNLVSGSGVVFYSMGFENGKGLRDLVLPSAMKPMSLIVSYKGQALNSTPAIWWGNLVSPLANAPAGQTLSTSRIYTVSGTLTGAYQIWVDKAAVVSLGSDSKIVTVNNHYAVPANAQKFLWIEVNVEDLQADSLPAISFTNVKASRLHNTVIKTTSSTAAGVLFSSSSDSNLITSLKIVATAGSEGLRLLNSSKNLFDDVEIEGSGAGVSLMSGSERNAFSRLRVAKASPGFQCQNGAVGNTLIDSVFSDTGTAGVSTYSGCDDFRMLASTALTSSTANSIVSNAGYYSHLTAYSSLMGFYMSGDYNTFGSAYVGGRSSYGSIFAGLQLEGASNNSLSDLVLDRVSSKQILLTSASNSNEFTGRLILRNSPECDNEGTENSIEGPACTTVAGVQGLQRTVLDVNESLGTFVGILEKDDSHPNSLGIESGLGQVDFASILSWVGFSSRHRFWGNQSIDNSLEKAAPGRCESGTCQAWDLALTPNDTLLRNHYDCPTSDTRISHGAGPYERIFFEHAIETLQARGSKGLPAGNGNGLCEAGETCTLLRNIGAYFGDTQLEPVSLCAPLTVDSKLTTFVEYLN